MICPNCGLENISGSRFCKQCGTALSEAPQTQYAPPEPAFAQPPQPMYAPPSYAPPSGIQPEKPKKKAKTGLIIGICAGVLLIAAAVLAVLFLFPFGTSVEGYWVNEDKGVVVSFEMNGEVTIYSLSGSVNGDYDYDKKEGEGSFKADKIKYEFTADEDRLKVTNQGTDETIKFSRAENEPNIEEIVTAPLLGIWTNEELGQVLELKEGGKAESHSPEGELSGKFEFNTKKGECTIDFDNVEYVFTSDGETLTVKDNAEPVSFLKASDSLDIDAFVTEHSNKILGIWYDSSGVYGTLEFLQDGTYIYTTFGTPYYGTYTYDSASGIGEFISTTGTSGSIQYSDGSLYCDGIYFTQDYVEQMNNVDAYASITGTWYDSSGSGYITFNDDGSCYMFDYNTYATMYGNITYNPMSQYGQITLSDYSTMEFNLSGDAMYINNAMFTREVANSVASLNGTWYDNAGLAGTITFYSDNTVYMDYNNSYLYGTYEYDYSLGYGSMQFESEGSTLQYSLYLYGSQLYVYDSNYNVVYYTQTFVYQN